MKGTAMQRIAAQRSASQRKAAHSNAAKSKAPRAIRLWQLAFTNSDQTQFADGRIT
jgi:hypothetical protein